MVIFNNINDNPDEEAVEPFWWDFGIGIDKKGWRMLN